MWDDNGNKIDHHKPRIKIANFSPFGWSHYAPQRIFGYFNSYDFMSVLLGFAIDGTRIDGNDFTVRLWKGNYGLGGMGCEIGLYSTNGKSLNKKELKALGLESSTAILLDENNKEIDKQHEDTPSFWTTLFKPFRFKKRENLNSKYILSFKDEKSAKAFYYQIGGEDKEKAAYKYYWNHENRTHIRREENTVIIDYKSRSLDNEN